MQNGLTLTYLKNMLQCSRTPVLRASSHVFNPLGLDMFDVSKGAPNLMRCTTQWSFDALARRLEAIAHLSWVLMDPIFKKYNDAVSVLDELKRLWNPVNHGGLI
jgi:hypothetical protein